jgi:cysteine desulfurase
MLVRVVDNSCMEPIYLDHNATTPTRPEVVEAMARCFREVHANAASQHRAGQRAQQVLEEARESIGEDLGAVIGGAVSDRVLFTSGGTEANNLAVLGLARGRLGAPPGQVIVSAIEHPSVIGPAERLLDEGWRLDTLGVTASGAVRVDQLPPLLTPQTRLVSVMLANHDTGVLQPVAELAALANDAGVPVHSDAVQAVGKRPVHFRSLGVAAMSLSAHKFQGPAGIGALIVRAGTPLAPLQFGGHQQHGLRPGTEPVALAVGMATALRLARQEQHERTQRIERLLGRLEGGLRAGYPRIVINGEDAERLPQTANIAFPGHDGQVLLLALDLAGVACSVGAACSSGSAELSPTLRAMGLPKEVVSSSLRFSLGPATTEAEIDEAVRRILHVLRALEGS